MSWGNCEYLARGARRRAVGRGVGAAISNPEPNVPDTAFGYKNPLSETPKNSPIETARTLKSIVIRRLLITGDDRRKHKALFYRILRKVVLLECDAGHIAKRASADIFM